MPGKRPPLPEIISAEALKQHPGFNKYMKWITEQTDELWRLMAKGGNDKRMVCDCYETTMDGIQDIVMRYLHQMTPRDQVQVNKLFVIAAALAKVALRQPMYDTPALELQLREEVKQLLTKSRGYNVGIDGLTQEELDADDKG